MNGSKVILCPGCGQPECQASSQECWGAGGQGDGIEISVEEMAARQRIQNRPYLSPPGGCADCNYSPDGCPGCNYSGRGSTFP